MAPRGMATSAQSAPAPDAGSTVDQTPVGPLRAVPRVTTAPFSNQRLAAVAVI